jgi:predicted neutral ceramidase superfamily lipid hydrolase
MAANFHEQFDEAVQRPSDRSTGLVFAAASIVVAVIYHRHMTVMVAALALAVLLGGVSLLASRFLRPLNIVWFNFGQLLQKVVRPLVMGVLFSLAIVPFGFFMRLRYDPLRAKIGPNLKSYWIERGPSGQGVTSMKNQF